jgi:hypothetical protein
MTVNQPAIRSSLPTIIAVAVVAYAASDSVHELLGHGSMALLSGIKITSISSVGLQSVTSSRLLSAAGSAANVVAGVISFLGLRSAGASVSARYFLWLFGFVNLMNGTCYLLASAVLDNGDWSVVIAGLHPDWAWRIGMGLVGMALYWLSIRWAAAQMADLVREGKIFRGDLVRLTLPAYLTGGVLLTVAAIFNPFSPSLILLSGAGASLGLTWGLLLVPGMVESQTRAQESAPDVLAFSWRWITLAAAVAVAFVGVFGPGLRFW